VPIEDTVKPMLGYLGLLFVCLLVICGRPALRLSSVPARFRGAFAPRHHGK